MRIDEIQPGTIIRTNKGADEVIRRAINLQGYICLFLVSNRVTAFVPPSTEIPTPRPGEEPGDYDEDIIW